jgi:thiamine-monophosphate kinase
LAESQFYRWLTDNVTTREFVRIGIGDDAALVDWGDPKLVITSDLLAESVHFDADTPLHRVGHKALAVNLSDLAAMGAVPKTAVVSLLLNRSAGLNSAQTLIEGMQPLADRHQVAIVGGDTNSWDGPLVINVTAIGGCEGRAPLRRGGAQTGDMIVVTGTLGGSLLDKHLEFQPRIDEALALARQYEIHAAMDISDGLSIDLARMAEASGCAALLRLNDIPISDAAKTMTARDVQAGHRDVKTALERALSDGEDFELLLAVSPDVAAQWVSDPPFDLPITEIGRFVDGNGLWSDNEDGSREALRVRGYEHEL